MEYIASLPVSFWVTFATMIVTLILGQLSKKYTKINSKIIPIQNLLIGVIVCAIEYAITKDFNSAVAISGIFSGGIYDVTKAITQIMKKEEN